MNAKQIAPIVTSLATVAPPLLVIGGLAALAIWLLSDDEKKEPENAPANAAPQIKLFPSLYNSGGNSPENRGIPAISGGKSSVLPARATVPANPASAAPKAPVQTTFPSGQIVPATTATEHQRLRVPPVSGVTPAQSAPSTVLAGSNPPASKIPVKPLSVVPAVGTAPPIPPAVQKKFITRADMAKIFNGGNRGLTRKSAVAALKALGFGKTAAYEALAINGRFISWLQFVPDGIITWKS